MSLSVNKNILWFIVIVLIILNVISLATLWLTRDVPGELPPREARMPGMGSGAQYLKRELNFSPDQEARFDSLMIHHRARIENKINEIRILRKELMSRMRNREFTGEAEQLVREIGEKQAELELMNFRHFRDVMEICNEGQKQIFLNTIRNAVGPRRLHDGRGPHGPGWRRGR